MKKLILTLGLTIVTFSLFSKPVKLYYSGKNAEIKAAVNDANKLLSNPAFYARINAISKFDNTSYSGSQISEEMQNCDSIEVTDYYKLRSKTNAKTQNKIKMNKAKLNRSRSSIVNTLIHETIHAIDWRINKKWDYTHRTQYEEKPPVSAPYVIAELAERFQMAL
jgi:hypothetical protein